MTCREKLMQERPERIDSFHIGGCNGCPEDYGYLSKPEWCAVNDRTCRACWDREINIVEPGNEESKRKVTKVKLFARVAIPTLEDAINEFIAGKEIIDMKFQVNVFAGNPMGSAMIVYREAE